MNLKEIEINFDLRENLRAYDNAALEFAKMFLNRQPLIVSEADYEFNQCAELAYRFADAMIEVRGERLRKDMAKFFEAIEGESE